MKKLKLSQKYYDPGDSCNLDFLISLPFINQTELTVTSLKDLSQRDIALELPIAINPDTCMVPLPDNKVFFYGYLQSFMNHQSPRSPQDLALSGITFILEKDFKVEILNEGIPRYGCGGVYFDGYIYIFGGFTAPGISTNIASIYDLKAKSWKTITSTPSSVRECSCVEYMGFILIGGHSSLNKVFAYDVAGDSYSEVLSDIKGNKVFCKYNGYAYLFNTEGRRIYESEYNNPFAWKVIKRWEIDRRLYDFVNFQMIFEEFFYFVEFEASEYYYHRFNLVSREMDNDNWSKFLKYRL